MRCETGLICSLSKEAKESNPLFLQTVVLDIEERPTVQAITFHDTPKILKVVIKNPHTYSRFHKERLFHKEREEMTRQEEEFKITEREVIETEGDTHCPSTSHCGTAKGRTTTT